MQSCAENFCDLAQLPHRCQNLDKIFLLKTLKSWLVIFDVTEVVIKQNFRKIQQNLAEKTCSDMLQLKAKISVLDHAQKAS